MDAGMREIYNEGRVVGLSAYELYVRQSLTMNPDLEVLTEAEWLAMSLGAGSSMVLKIKAGTTAGVHDYYLPEGSRLLGSASFVGSLFEGNAVTDENDEWAVKILSYGKLVENDDANSPQTPGFSENVPTYPNPEQLDQNYLDVVTQFVKIRDAVVVQPGEWIPNMEQPAAAKRLHPDLTEQGFVRISFLEDVTKDFYIHLHGFLYKIGPVLFPEETEPSHPQDGDFLGPVRFPWSVKVIWALPIAAYHLIEEYIKELGDPVRVIHGGTERSSHRLNSVLVGNGIQPIKNVPSETGALYSQGEDQEPQFGILPVSCGGTGVETNPSMLVNLASDDPDEVLKVDPRPGVTGVLDPANGGTGQTSLQATRNAMGLGNTLGALPIANGGTGATNAADARTNLGAAPINHASTATTYGLGNASNYGHVKLSDSLSSTSSVTGGIAATPNAIKTVYDRALKMYDPSPGSGGGGEVYGGTTIYGQLATSANIMPTHATSQTSQNIGSDTLAWNAMYGNNLYTHYIHANINYSDKGYVNLTFDYQHADNKEVGLFQVLQSSDGLAGFADIACRNIGCNWRTNGSGGKIGGEITARYGQFCDEGAVGLFVGRYEPHTTGVDMESNLEVHGNAYGYYLELYQDKNGGRGYGLANSWEVRSSRKYKDNIREMTEECAEELLRMRPVTFDYKDGTKDCKGLIAEEVAEIDNFAVGYKDGEPNSIDYGKFSAQLIKLCQMQQKQIDELTKRVEALEANQK